MIVLSTVKVLGSLQIQTIQHHGSGAQTYLSKVRAPDHRVKISLQEQMLLQGLDRRMK